MKIGLRKAWLAITPNFAISPLRFSPVEMTKVSSVQWPSPARDGVKIARLYVVPEFRWKPLL